MSSPSQSSLTPLARFFRSRRALAIPLIAVVVGIGAFAVYGSADSRSGISSRDLIGDGGVTAGASSARFRCGVPS